MRRDNQSGKRMAPPRRDKKIELNLYIAMADVKKEEIPDFTKE